MEQLYLSRRNLLVLLSKLDRAAHGEKTHKTIIKVDTQNPKYPQSMPEIRVIAVEDAEYYGDRKPGPVHEADDPARRA